MSEVERKLRANDREYNLSFKYAVSINVLLLVSLPHKVPQCDLDPLNP